MQNWRPFQCISHFIRQAVFSKLSWYALLSVKTATKKVIVIRAIKMYVVSKLIEMRFVLILLFRNDFAHFTKIAITPVWDLIETWGFREDLPLVFPHDPR